MKITVFFKSSKCKQVIQPELSYFALDKNGNTLTELELKTKGKNLALDLFGSDVFDVAVDVFE